MTSTHSTSSSSSSLSSTTRSTSQSTSTLTAGSIAAALTNELQRNTNFLLSQLTNMENGTASATTNLGTMKAVELKGAPGNSSFVAAVVDGSAAAVVLPLETLGELGESAVLVLTTFDGPESSELGSPGQKAQTRASRPIQSATPAVDISIVDKDSFSAQEVQVRTPIFVRIAEVAPEPNWICAYLDGDTWSTEGVRLATPAELETAFGGQADTSGVWCATLHLSIFGAFIDILLDCTNANMLSQEGLREIVERQGWWMRPPALGVWLLLASSLLLIALGRLSDARLHRSGFWRDEYFLTDLPPVPESLPCLCGTSWFGSRKERQTTDDGDASHEEEVQEAEEASEAEEAEDSPAQRARGRRPSQSSLPSIMSQLSRLRAGIADPQSMQLRRDLLKRLKPNLAAGMQERVICRNTLWEVARQHNIHTSSIQTHIWGRSGWVQGSLAVQRSPQLKALAYALEETLPRAFVEVHTSRAQRLWAAMVASHPVYELWMCDLHMTAAKRAKIMMDCLLGSLAFVALFFSVDGTAVAARSPAECPIDQGSFLWYIFVAMLSILLNFVPRRLEIYLARRGFVQESRLNRRWQLRVRRLKDVGFWAFSLCLSGLHLVVVSAFLANMAEVDEGKWMFTFFVVLLRKFVLVPLLACLFSSLGTELSGWGQERIMPPRKLGLDLQLDGEETVPTAESDKQVWLDKVKELAGRGITIRQLLDFYVDLGHEVMKHFDPKKSTTHDVVRQAIIPRSLQLRDSRYLVVVVHRATGLSSLDLFSGSDPYCVVSVQGSGGVSKPWKGGGRTPYVSNDQNPVWEESFLVEDVLHEEVLYFSLWDHDFASKDDPLGNASLPVCNCWFGLRGVLDVRDGQEGGRLYVSIKAYETPDEAQAAWRPPEKALRFISGSGSLSAIRSSVRKQKSGGTPDDCFDLWDTDEGTAVGSRHAKKFIPSASRGVLAEDPHAQGEDEAATGEYHGYAYAAVMNGGRPHLAQKMVTHSWRNIFSHLIAAIVADALDVEKYDEIAKLLVNRKFSTLSDALRRKNSLDVRYWVCAFSVNQHAGICATPPPVDSTGHAIAPCRCTTPKHFAGDLSEMNKFDDMMAFLKRSLRQQGQVRLEQVIALETDFGLLTRVWCVAELVEANELHLQQAVKIHSASSRDVCLDRLVQLDVRSAEASFPADKELVLNKIHDVEDFNTRLQDLMLHRMESFLQTSRASTAADLFDEAILAVVNVAI
ncbi:Synaptotagmin-4 [Symbiodinium microadriaticum]|uniref:Synaptotagmin-4 n=1 Tax=Symbiodinium microadriaticum TaxID=2951 RepID=A0A1Q9E3A5_SYMMI|nr:Synaptotagmin-4 [Symbiodinium microadriaticum]CAE7245713.1 SYT4 [Symbiodinium microadriaticum]